MNILKTNINHKYYLKKLTYFSNKIVYLFIILIVNSCNNKQPIKEEYVARVNDSFLYKKQLKFLSDDKFIRNDLIYDWIDNEILYQEALKLKIIPNDEYDFIVENTKKRLAARYLIDKIINDSLKNYKINDEAIYNYYLNNKKEFVANQKIYEVIISNFNDINEAKEFIKKFDNTKLDNYDKLYFEESELLPNIKMLFENTQKNNLTKIIKMGNNYKVYYIYDIIEPNTVKKFQIVRNQAKEIYLYYLKKKIIDSYIKNLYSKNTI